MAKKGVLTKTLAIVGTVLVWFPILAPILFSVLALTIERMFRFDYLMPAELFPAALIGGGLLLWAALRARSRRRLIGWGLGIAVGLLVGGQALAVVTGLASGETEPAGWWFALVLASIAAYSLALVAMGVGGALLLRDLFKARRSPTEGP
jgi:peptidoglycan/LPS O-acetylase OafA/YrhL